MQQPVANKFRFYSIGDGTKSLGNVNVIGERTAQIQFLSSYRSHVYVERSKYCNFARWRINTILQKTVTISNENVCFIGWTFFVKLQSTYLQVSILDFLSSIIVNSFDMAGLEKTCTKQSYSSGPCYSTESSKLREEEASFLKMWRTVRSMFCRFIRLSNTSAGALTPSRLCHRFSSPRQSYIDLDMVAGGKPGFRCNWQSAIRVCDHNGPNKQR